MGYLKLELYIDGVRCTSAFSRIELVEAVDQPIQWSIMLPYAKGVHIRQRALVQVFFKNELEKTFKLLVQGEKTDEQIVIGAEGVAYYVIQGTDLLQQFYIAPTYFYDLNNVLSVTQVETTATKTATTPLNTMAQIAEEFVNASLKNAPGGEKFAAGEFINQIILRTARAPYYRAILNQYNLANMFDGFGVAEVYALMQGTLFEEYMNGQLQGVSGDFKVFQLLLQLLHSILYVYSPIASPYFNSKRNKLPSFLAIPSWTNGIPPTCNILMPSNISQLQFASQESAKPTRLVIPGSIFGVPTSAPIGVAEGQNLAPKQLRDIYAGKVSESSYQVDNTYSIQFGSLANVFNHYTDEEWERGIVDITLNVPIFGLLCRSADFRTKFSTVTDFYFEFLRAQQNRLVLNNGPFNPYAVVGMPLLVIIPKFDMHFLGILNIKNTSIDASGISSTSYQLGQVYLLNKPETIPPFFQESFDTNLMNNFYNRILGINALSNNNMVTVKKAGNSLTLDITNLLNTYVTSDISSLIYRDIVDISTAMQILGADASLFNGNSLPDVIDFHYNTNPNKEAARRFENALKASQSNIISYLNNLTG
ncbi:MAG: hypothetical protein ACP5LM_04135 [Thermoplasmata archaeon]